MSQLPDVVTRRDLLAGHKKASEAELRSLAEAYEKNGQLNDAIDFWAKLDAEKELERIAKKVTEEGDVFLLLRLKSKFNKLHLENELQRAVVMAEKLGKYSYVIKAYELLGDEINAKLWREKVGWNLEIEPQKEST